jgi:NAD-reducing hydrogenase small subunit
MSLLDIDERIVALLELVELTSSPVTDLKHPPEEGVAVGVLEGAINNTVNLRVARQMRQRCKTLVALGDCAVFGGVPAMRNAFTTKEALERAYITSESTVDGKVPQDPELGRLTKRCCSVGEMVPVDVNLPGCPPSADAIFNTLSALLEGRAANPTGDDLKYD